MPSEREKKRRSSEILNAYVDGENHKRGNGFKAAEALKKYHDAGDEYTKNSGGSSNKSIKALEDMISGLEESQKHRGK